MYDLWPFIVQVILVLFFLGKKKKVWWLRLLLDRPDDLFRRIKANKVKRGEWLL